jgi:Na+/proline symporter/signal transduction histidine kinase
MGLDLISLFGFGLSYLLLLFLIAYAADSGRISERLLRHPLVYVLSLGVLATSWTYYGSVGFAQTHGYVYLAIYFGVTLAFALSPVFFQPILHLTREYQLRSLADLFAFRYRSHLAGILVTLFMLVGALPYIALQIRAVTESIQVLSQEAPPKILALGFCLTLILFAILFGARHISSRERHRGLVAAIAFESLIKLLALLAIGMFALFGIFAGPDGLSHWLSENPAALERLYQPVQEGPWYTLILLAFAAAFLLPRQFHMLFVENLEPKAMATASWAFPLFLLLMNLPVPLILWAGNAAEIQVEVDYFALGITLSQETGWLPVIAFIGGLSSASAMMIITTLALASMTLNHILLPTNFPDPAVDLYRWLLWGRRFLIGIIIMAGYGFYLLVEENQALTHLGLISFVAVAQFLPGIVGLLFWRRANRIGFILGLLAGITVWSVTLLLPLLEASGLIRLEFDTARLQAVYAQEPWEFATFWSLCLNAIFFVLGSMLSKSQPAEQQAAIACSSDSYSSLENSVVSASSATQFTHQLSQTLGRETAEKEVQQALTDLGLSAAECRPGELRRLRARIERNLSGLIGPQLAHVMINQRLQLDEHTKTALADSMRYVEEQLEHSRSRLQGLNADLDSLRRYHRQVLLDLPLGVCTLDRELTVTIWNLAMEKMTGLGAAEVKGVNLTKLPCPWGNLLAGFASARDEHIHHMEIKHYNQSRWFNLHKAAILISQAADHKAEAAHTSQVIIMEDLTDLENLEAELAHSDRLASIGRLAAGVAHEIGNPVTGIASLAQNLRDEKDYRVIDTSVKEILQQTRRITDIIKSLMNFSRRSGIGNDIQQCSVKEIVEEAMRLVHLTQQGREVECENLCPANLTLTCERQGILQVLVNLLSNACDASSSGDRVEVLAFEHDGTIRIEILDQGQGIDSEQLEYIFEPFYTTKAPGEGTGLGLPLAYKIISDHKGKIQVDSESGVGTRVVLELAKKPDLSV